MTEQERAKIREFFKSRADRAGIAISDDRLDAVVDGFIDALEEDRRKRESK